MHDDRQSVNISRMDSEDRFPGQWSFMLKSKVKRKRFKEAWPIRNMKRMRFLMTRDYLNTVSVDKSLQCG